MFVETRLLFGSGAFEKSVLPFQNNDPRITRTDPNRLLPGLLNKCSKRPPDLTQPCPAPETKAREKLRGVTSAQ